MQKEPKLTSKAALGMWLTRNIISEDTEFKEVRKDFLDAGYTQEDISKSLESTRKNA